MWWLLVPAAIAAGYAGYRKLKGESKRDPVYPDIPRVTPGEFIQGHLLPRLLPKGEARPAPEVRASSGPSALSRFVGAAIPFVLLGLLVSGLIFKIPMLTLAGASGIVGWGTNFVAIRLLFRPRKPVFGIQGLIPAHREQIIDGLASGVDRYLLDREKILREVRESGLVDRFIERAVTALREASEDPESRTAFRHAVLTSINDAVSPWIQDEESKNRLRERLKEMTQGGQGVTGLVMELAGPSVADQMVDHLEKVLDDLPQRLESWTGDVSGLLDVLVKTLEANRDSLAQTFADAIGAALEELDVKELIAKNLRDLDENQIEKMVWGASSRELGFITWMGGILGALAGCVLGFIL